MFAESKDIPRFARNNSVELRLIPQAVGTTFAKHGQKQSLHNWSWPYKSGWELASEQRSDKKTTARWPDQRYKQTRRKAFKSVQRGFDFMWIACGFLVSSDASGYNVMKKETSRLEEVQQEVCNALTVTTESRHKYKKEVNNAKDSSECFFHLQIDYVKKNQLSVRL